ncbi:MAG: DNA polymerase V [Acidimicrobiales bacterium]|jgi:DNA polymerase V
MNTEMSVKEVARPVGVPSSGTTELPLYASSPSAGFPAPGDDQVERVLDINDLVVQNPASTFFVRVEGDSMTGAGIFSGDVLVIDRSKDPKDGTIVVAAINGEMVVKRLKTQSKGCYPLLVSENDEYAPIEVSEGEDCTIWGVVVGSVRQF